VAWESCMTMNDTWGYKADDHNWKSTETLVRNLIDIASKGGNYLLNIGPTGEGEIPVPSLERLAAIGAWMKVNGESIHGTTATRFAKYSWDGRSTTRVHPDGSATIYIHVFNRPEDGNLTIGGLSGRPASATLLGAGNPLEISGKEGAWTVRLPEFPADTIARVVALKFAKTPEK